MEQASEAHQLKVGKYYWVHCLKGTYDIGHGYRVTNLPLLPPIHSDPELGADRPHYHYDWRFLRGKGGIPEFGKIFAFNDPRDIETHQIHLLKKKCVRTEVSFPTLLCTILEPLYSEKKVDWSSNNPVCPHRQISLKGRKTINGEYVVCPGHGLAWCPETGLMVNRPKDPVFGCTKNFIHSRIEK